MPIELIPRGPEEKPLWPEIIFYFSFVLLAVGLIGYFVLGRAVKNAANDLTQVNQSLNKERSVEELALEEEVLQAQQKIKNFSSIIGSHRFTSRVFDLLEKTTHPRVFFNKFGFNPADSKISLTGKTESFKTLGEQLLALRENSAIARVDLVHAAINRSGAIDFGLDLLIKEEVLKE